jgi:hypothetical protein
MNVKPRLFLLALCFAFAGPAFAAGKPNIVVVGADTDPASVRHDSLIHARAASALSDQLHEAGFDVFDALDLFPRPAARARRSDRDIVGAARLAKRPPLDIVVIFQAYAKARENDYGTWVGARVAGRMLNVRTGQLLATFELASPKLRRAPPACARPCLVEIVGREAQILARDMGAALAEKLIWVSDPAPPTPRKPDKPDRTLATVPHGYALVLDGFTPEDVTEIEEYLVVFRDYNRHRPVRAGARHHEFWYESGAGSGRLYRNLKKMLTHMGLRGRVDFSGNVFTIAKISRRAERGFEKGDW